MNKHCIESAGRVAAAHRIARAPRRLPLAMALAAMLGTGFLAPSGAGAATYTWTGNGGNATWGNGRNWSTQANGMTITNQAPLQHSSVLFNTNVPATIYGVPTGNGFDNITFGFNSAATTFEMDSGGGAIGLSGGIGNFSGKKQTFKFRIDAQGDQTWAGGSAGVVVNNTGDLNYSLTLADVTMVNVGNVNTTVGSTGTGVLNLGVKSSLEAPEVMLGKEENSKGTLNLTHAEAKLGAVGNLIVGFAGEGILNINAGQVSSNQAFIGMNYGSLGSVLIDGTTSKLTATSALEVGRASTGGVTVQNGGTLISGESFIGRSLGGDGLLVVTGAGSSWTVTGPLTVGDVGVGSVRVEAGGTLNSLGATLGSQAGSLGQVRVAGANASWVATGHDVQVGHLGDGLLSIEQGGLVSNRNTLVGVIGDPGTSRLTVTGVNSRLLSSDTLTVQSGSVEITNGGQAKVSQAHFAEHGVGATAQVDLSGTGAMLTTTSWLGIGGDTGQATLNLGAGATLNSTGEMYVGKGGVLNLNGGTLNANYNAYFFVGGQVNWNTGTVNINSSAATGDRLLDHSLGLGAGMNINVANRLTIQAGDNLSFTGGQGSALELLNDGDLGVGSLSTLRVGTGGVLNRSALLLAGGTISSVGRLDNAGLVSGHGTIAGSGGFVNSGLLRQGDGNLVLSNTGDILNTGTWEMQAGRSLTVSASLDNRAALSLGGGSLLGSGSVVNSTQGVISGSGRIATAFYNQGAVVVDAGLTQIDPSFTNRGQILLGANSATLSGGQIGNHGLIQGLGRINSDISNIDPIGVIEAQGGTLTLAGRIVSPNAGVLAVESGAKLLVSQGLASNAGQIQLAGGTFDNNGRALVNEASGSINGFGGLRAGLLANRGQLFLSGGSSAVRADVVAEADSAIIVSGQSNATFYGTVEVKADAELRVSQGSSATFAGHVWLRTDSNVNGDGLTLLEGGYSVGNSPGYGYWGPSMTWAASNFYEAEIGGITACTAACASDEDFRNSSFDKLVVGGKLKFGGKLILTSWNGFVAQAGQSFDLLDWASSSGTFKTIDASGLKLAAGTQLDYSQLYTTGTISVTAVPEPESYALLLAGLGVIGFVARRRRSGL